MISESLRLLTLTTLLLVSNLAQAKEKSQIVHYPVAGKTAAEVYTFIKTKAPRVASNATFAFTMIATKVDKQDVLKAGSCRTSRYQTSVVYSFVLPQHSKLAALPALTRKKWLSFADYLQNHEAQHRAIWRRCFANFDAAALSLRAPDCATLEAIRAEKLETAKRACLAQDEELDVEFRKEVLGHAFIREASTLKP